VAVAPEHVDAIVQGLVSDLATSLGWDVEDAAGIVRQTAAAILDFVDQEEWFTQKLVEDVQQYMHDAFLDTSWPACPRHPNHPLELSDDEPTSWTCPRDGVPACQLGHLGDVVHPDAVKVERNRTRLADEQAEMARLMATWTMRRGGRRRP
jgi:hypothetical protein